MKVLEDKIDALTGTVEKLALSVEAGFKSMHKQFAEVRSDIELLAGTLARHELTFASKEDLRNLATKDDLKKLRQGVKY